MILSLIWSKDARPRLSSDLKWILDAVKWRCCNNVYPCILVWARIRYFRGLRKILTPTSLYSNVSPHQLEPNEPHSKLAADHLDIFCSLNPDVQFSVPELRTPLQNIPRHMHFGPFVEAQNVHTLLPPGITIAALKEFKLVSPVIWTERLRASTTQSGPTFAEHF